MKYLLSLLLGFNNPDIIHVENSVDWLCYESQTIASVKVDEYHHGPFTCGSYSADCYVSATITGIYKGQEPQNNNIVIYSRLNWSGSDKWEKQVGRELMVFLKDLGCDKYCSYGIWDDSFGMMDINSPAPKALTGDFRMIMKKDTLVSYIKDCVKKLEGKKAQPYFLEVPYETDAYGALYAGSSCYLIVPDVLYPNAKKGMN